MTRLYQDLGSAFDWMKQIFFLIGSTTQIWVVRHHQYEISALASKTSFEGENQWWQVFP